jgi:hypothetical protein
VSLGVTRRCATQLHSLRKQTLNKQLSATNADGPRFESLLSVGLLGEKSSNAFVQKEIRFFVFWCQTFPNHSSH